MAIARLVRCGGPNPMEMRHEHFVCSARMIHSHSWTLHSPSRTKQYHNRFSPAHPPISHSHSHSHSQSLSLHEHDLTHHVRRQRETFSPHTSSNGLYRRRVHQTNQRRPQFPPSSSHVDYHRACRMRQEHDCAVSRQRAIHPIHRRR